MFQQSTQQTKFMPIYDNLNDIYADIEDELCSKQSTLLGQLKNKFAKLYDGLVPSHFIMVNHIASLSNGLLKQVTGDDIKFSMQNGLIFLLKKTYQGQNIFINSSIFNKELEYNCQGKIIKLDSFKKSTSTNQQKISKEIQKIIDLASQQLSINKLFGGVIYIYNNIKESVSNFKQKLLLGIYLSILIINDQLQQISIQQIYKKLYSQKQYFTQEFLSKQLMSQYMKRNFLIQKLSYSKKDELFPLQKNKKLVFFDTGLQQDEKIQIKNKKTQMLNKIQSLRQKLFFKQAVNKCSEIFNINGQDSNKNTIETFKSIKQLICSNNSQLCIYPKQFLQSIEEKFKQFENLQYLIIQQGQYLVFCVNTHQSHEFIRKLRQILIPKNLQNPQLIQRRFNSKNIKIDQKIFSCSPSLGLAILNPENQIWFK